MESNEQTELTNKIQTDIDREQGDSSREAVPGWRDRAKKKRAHGHGQQCGNCRGEGV